MRTPVPNTVTGSNWKPRRADFKALQGQGHDIWNSGYLGNTNTSGDFSLNSVTTTNNPSMTYSLTSALDFKG